MALKTGTKKKNSDEDTSNASESKESKAAETVDKLKWWILATVIVGTFLGRLDQTIVNIALPKIIDDFGITITAAGWIGTAYILANAVFVPVWGKLGDTIGRKKVYMLGFGIFIAGSVLAGFAWNLGSLLVFRVIQAIASSADYPTAMAIIAITFRQGKERAQALGLWSVSFAAAAVFGPLIGGPLIDTFGWRSVFLINLPVGIAGMIMATIFISESTSGKKNIKFDWWGAVTLGIALSALVLILDKGMDWGWLSLGALILYVISATFFTIFYRIEKNHPDPIVDLKFFKSIIFVGTIINNFVVFMALMGAIFLIPVFVATFLGYNATQTGLIFLPMAFFMVIASFIGSKFTGKVKSYIVITISTFIAGVGLLTFVILDPRSTMIDVIIPLSIMAFGLGLGMSQRTNAIASVVDSSEMGIASSVLALARNIAGAFGIAMFGTILQNSINRAVMDTAKNSVIHVTSSLVYQQAASLIILHSYIVAYHTVFYIAAAVLFVGAILSFVIKPKVEKLGVEVHVE